MECKIVRDNIDLELLSKDVHNHLETCELCSTYYKDHLLIEEGLHETYSDKITFNSRKRDIMNHIRPRKRKKGLLIAALLFLMLTVSFADEIYAIAEDIPLVGDLMKYFMSNESAEYAKAHDYPMQDLIFEKDGYKLLVNDFYADPYMGQFMMALEKDGELIRGFSYAVIREDMEIFWRDERNENTPWTDVLLFKELDDDIRVNIGIRVDNQEIIFDEIFLSENKINQFAPKIINCNEVIDSEYGSLKIESIEIYPTTMYINTSYDYTEDIMMIHLMDLKLIDNYGKEYIENSISILVNDEQKQRFRIYGSCYYDEDVSSLEIDFSTLKLKISDEVLDVSLEELEGQEFNDIRRYGASRYIFKDVDVDDETIYFNLEVSELSDNAVPLYLTIYQNKQWVMMEREDVIEALLPEDEQYVYMPLFQLCKWFDKDIHYIYDKDGEILIKEWEDKLDPYYEYRESYYYTREKLLKYIEAFDYDLSRDELDYVLRNKTKETIWINQMDFELISGLPLDELKQSDAGKAKIIDHLASEYYVYADFDRIDEWIKLIIEHGRIGIGGYLNSEFSEVSYSGSYKEGRIRIGLFKSLSIPRERKIILELN